MNEDISYLKKLKENEKVELKRCKEKISLSVYESYCAMANSSGGEIFLGIEENEPENIISGVDNSQQKIKQLCNTLATNSKISNIIFSSSDISLIKTDDGDVIKINVPPTPIDQRPAYLDSDPTRAYKRVHEGDKLLDDDEIQAMLNDSNKTKFDQCPNEYGFDLKDLDEEALSQFEKSFKSTRKIPSMETMNIVDILNRIGATIVDKKTNKLVMTNGAVLFFGKSYAVNSVSSSLWLDYQERISPESRFTDRITIKDLSWEPNIYNFFRHVYQKICDGVKAPFHLKNGTNVGKALLEEILREAIANSISNLELRSSKGLLIIKTANSLSLRNAGGIMTGLEQAKKGGVSIPRNPCIFNFFLALGISDHGGFGIPKIFDCMKELNMPEPDLQESLSRDETSLLLRFTQINTSLTKDEQEAFLFLSNHNEGVTSTAIAQLLKCSNEAARKVLLSLVAKGQAVDNGNKSKGRLYYPLLCVNESDFKKSASVIVARVIQENSNYQISDLQKNDFNAILTKTQSDNSLELITFSEEDGEIPHTLIRRPSVGFCAIETDGLGDYKGSFDDVSSNVIFVEINKFIETTINKLKKIEIIDKNNSVLLEIINKQK